MQVISGISDHEAMTSIRSYVDQSYNKDSIMSRSKADTESIHKEMLQFQKEFLPTALCNPAISRRKLIYI